VFSRRASRGCRSPIRRFRFLAAASAQASPGQEDRRASLARTSEAIGSREPEDVPSYSFGPSPCIRLLWPLLTSRSAFPRRPFSREAGYPQARTPSFRSQPPDLRRLSFDHESFAVTCPLALPSVASYPVLVHRLAVSLHASSPRSVALTQLRFASLAVVSSREYLHFQDHAHTGRTSKDRADRLSLILPGCLTFSCLSSNSQSTILRGSRILDRFDASFPL